MVSRSRFAIFSVAMALAWSCDPGKLAAQSLPEEALKKVKRATVLLKVKLANGGEAEGTGWFVEKGLIVTNAHVLNMQGGDLRKPEKIEAIIEGGEANSRTLVGRFVTGDHGIDISLIKVEGDNLPEPLTMELASDPFETQQVFIFGYPHGRLRGKSVTVTKSTITSFRKEKGIPVEIQLDGGLNPGNSGGPVVNGEGRVIGIAVGKLHAAKIDLAIPIVLLSRFMTGRVYGFNVEHTYREGTTTATIVRVTLHDRLRRVKKVQLEYWTGRNSDTGVRPASDEQPQPVEGDGEVQTVDVDYDGNQAQFVHVPVTALSNEKACYWFRVKIIDGADKPIWSAAQGNIRPYPIDRRKIVLNYRPAPGPKQPALVFNNGSFKSRLGARVDEISISVKVIMNPNVQVPDADGDIHTRLRFPSASMKMTVNGDAVNMKDVWQPVVNAFVKTSADVEYAPDGTVVYTTHKVDKKLSAQLQKTMTAISDQVLQSLELMSVPLSKGQFQPGDQIRAQKTLLVGFPGGFIPAQADLRYEYLGVAITEEGEETAYFRISADLRPRRGDDTKLHGVLSGAVELRLQNGELVRGKGGVHVEADVVDGVSIVGNLGLAYGTMPQPQSPPADALDAVAKRNVAAPSPDLATEKSP